MIRFLDIIISLTALILVLPFLFILFFIMALSQGFPIIFTQLRNGKDFKLFRLYKLRSMKQYSEDEYGLTKGLNDSRITKIGLFLRKYKIDEIPQLLNILKGEMSIVGSRPQVPFYTEKFRFWYEKILTEKPGLLSPSAIKFSNEEQILSEVENPVKYYEEVLVPIKCKMDIELVTNFNTKTYFSIIIQYFIRILFRR